MLNRMMLVAGLGVAFATVASNAKAAILNVSNANNILTSGNTVEVSSALPGVNNSNKAVFVDGLAPDKNEDRSFKFNNGDSQQRLSISGFLVPTGYQVSTIRIYTVPGDTLRVPVVMTVRSSTSVTSSLAAGGYESGHGTYSAPWTYQAYDPNDPLGNDRVYFDVALSAPIAAGAQSLYIDFGPATQPSASLNQDGDRIYELQALLTEVSSQDVPEPSSLVLAGLAVLGGLFVVRRKARKA